MSKSQLFLITRREPPIMDSELSRMAIPFQRYQTVKEAELFISDSSRAVVMLELSWDSDAIVEEVREFERVPCLWDPPLVVITPASIEPVYLDKIKRLNSKVRVVEVDESQVGPGGEVDSSVLSGFVQSLSGAPRDDAALPKSIPSVKRKEGRAPSRR